MLGSLWRGNRASVGLPSLDMGRGLPSPLWPMSLYIFSTDSMACLQATQAALTAGPCALNRNRTSQP